MSAQLHAAAKTTPDERYHELLRQWRAAHAQLSHSIHREDRIIEQHAWDALIEHVNSTSLTDTEWDPRS